MAIEGEEWRNVKQPTRDKNPDQISDRSEEEVLEQARDGIEKYRKGDVELALLAPDGRPAANRRVRIVQTRSEFLFGSPIYEVAAAAREGRMRGLPMQTYAHMYKSLLNAATALCYWNERGDPWMEKFQGDTKFREFVAQADWANAHGLTVKGHPLVWTVPKAIPDWLRRYDTETQMKFLEVRVRNLVGGLRDKVKMWDLVNEMLWEPSFRNLAKRHWPHIEPIDEILTYVAPAVHWGRDENPDAKFLINEYGLVYSVCRQPAEATAAAQRKRYLELAEALQKARAAPDALGIQAHTGGSWYRMADVWAVLDELSSAGLPLHITEFGAGLRNLDQRGGADLPLEEKQRLQADYCAKFYTVAFGHPAVEAVFYWGLPSSAFPFPRSTGQRVPSHVAPTPLYEALRRLLREEWMTCLEAVSDSDGRVRFRGFFGDYALRYSPERGSERFSAVRPGPTAITLRLSR